MGDYEHKPGSGGIFNNGYKERDNQPDMKGTMKTPDGQEWQISGWWKKTRNGDDFLSIAIQEPYQSGRGGGSGGQTHQQAPSPGRVSDEEFARMRAERRQGYRPATGGGSPGRGGSYGGGYGQTQRPPSARPGEVQGHNLPPMDDFSDDDIPF